MAMIQEFVRLQADVSVARQEFLLGMVARRILARARVPNGEGRPVLLLPGFGANEALLKRLNSYLRQNGYLCESFIPGFPQDESLREFIGSLSLTLTRKVKELRKKTGKPVSLVGQSAGGLYAREFTRQLPEGIDRVITLGTPTFYPENLHLQNKALAVLIERRFGTSADRAFSDDRFVHWETDSPAIPYVAIYSPVDGAVRTETVVIPESHLVNAKNGAVRENIAVTSSHFGMVLNPFVMLAVADRLGADPFDWKAFDPLAYLPERFHRLASLAYPSTAGAAKTVPSMDLHPRQPRGRDARERVIRTLKTEHENIGKLLNTVLDELAGPAPPNYAVIADILDYLHSYTDGFHHPREDLLFERLRQRRPDLEKITATLTEEHEWIDSEGIALEQTLQRHLESKRSRQRNTRLDNSCRRYVKRLQKHLQLEEKEVFPATKDLHRHDWLAVDKGLAYLPDPLFGRKVQQRYEELADALAGRVEGISATVAMGNVTSLEVLASCVDALGSGLTRLRKQNAAQLAGCLEPQKAVLKQSLDETSLMSLFTLPFRVTRVNGRLAIENSAANLNLSREIVADVGKAFRQARDNA